MDIISQEIDSRSEKLSIDIDNEIKARENEKERQDQINLLKKMREYRKSSEYSNICRKIESLFSDLAIKKKEWENYDDSFSGWDIFTLGISYAVKGSRKLDREESYKNVKIDLQKKLKEYYENPLIKEKHPKHDEV